MTEFRLFIFIGATFCLYGNLCVLLQECLEKCGESLQEIVNYHMVRKTRAPGQRWSVVTTHSGSSWHVNTLQASVIAQYPHTLTVTSLCNSESFHTGQSRGVCLIQTTCFARCVPQLHPLTCVHPPTPTQKCIPDCL